MNELLDDKGVIRKLKKEIEDLKRQLKGNLVVASPAVPAMPAVPATPDAAASVAPSAAIQTTKAEEVEQVRKAEQEKAQREQEALQSQLTEALRRIERAQEEAENAKKESAKKGGEVEELTATLTPLQWALTKNFTHRLQLEEMAKRDAAWLAAWRQLPEHAEETMDAALQKALTEIAQLQENQQGLEQRLATAESAQATLKRVEAEWSGLVAEKASAEAERAVLEKKVAEMKDTMEGVLKNVEVLYSTECEERQKAAALEAAVAAVMKERDTLQESVTAAAKERAALQQSVEAQEAVNKALQAQSAMLGQKQRSMKHQWFSEVGQLRKAKEELSKRLGSAVAEEKRLRAVLAEKEASLQSSSQCIQQMTLELHTLQTVIASNDDAIDELEACEVVSNDDLSRLKEVFLRQKQELLRSDKKVKETRVLNEELMRSVEGKERELNQMECELNEAREGKQELEEAMEKERAAKEALCGEVNALKEKEAKMEEALKVKKEELRALKAKEEELKMKTGELKEKEKDWIEREATLTTQLREKEAELKRKEDERKEKEANLTTQLQAKERELREKETQLNEHFPSTVENDSPSTMSESVLHDDRPTVEALQEDKTRLQTELTESQDRVARLQQTIRSKYAEYKQMKDTVKEAQEAATRLSADFDKLRKKYTAAKTRIAHLEKSKLSTSEMEKIKQLLKTKEAMREECQGLRAESKQLHEQLSTMKEEMTSAGERRG